MGMIYLDNNATTRPLPEVIEAMHACHSAGYANAASVHRGGQRARRVLEDAREEVGRMLGATVDGAESDQILFTSGGTEANNWAVFGLAGREPPGQIILSAIEHSSVSGPARHLQNLGWQVEELPASPRGEIELDRLPSMINDQTRLVCIMSANNETGVIQPIEKVATICGEAGVPLHVDAVQSVGKVPVDFRAIGAATMSVAAHKFHGPAGIGALIVRHGVKIQPLLFGGSQQSGLRPGTEPLPLVIGMKTAIDTWRRDAPGRMKRLSELRDRFERQVIQGLPDVVAVGSEASRLPHTSNLAFPGYDRQALLMALDMQEIACSAGSACASGASEPSHVLLAMGLPKPVIDGALRFGFSCFTTPEEADEAARRILLVCSNLRREK